MRKIIVVFLALIMIVSMAVAEDGAYINIGDYNETVRALHQKLGELGYYSLRPESPWSTASADALKILQFNTDMTVTGLVEDETQLNRILGIENVIGKNLLADTDFYIEKDSTSTDVISKSFSLKPDVDLQSLIGQTVTLSIYVNSPGERGTSVEDTSNYMVNRFGTHMTLIWADSNGVLEDKTLFPCIELLSKTVSGSRINSKYSVFAPEGYDTIKGVSISVQAGARPADGNVWKLGYPKLEYGSKGTEWLE